jgi:hypothetical protein
MKGSFSFFLVFSLFISTLSAQDCNKAFFAMKEKTKVTMSNFDGKGKLSSTSETVVKAVKSTDKGFAATMEVNIKNDKGKSTLDAKNYDVQCENGTIKLDISSMYMGDMAAQMKSMDVTISGSGIDIPATLSEGQTLSDGDSQIKMGTNGMTFMTMTFAIKNRKVEKKETITVGAGTYEAYKMTYDIDMKVIFKRSMKVVQWLVPSVGMIKSESYSAKGELEGSTEMTKFEQ